MGWFVNLIRVCLHALQLGCAITCLLFYRATYDGVTKDYRWKFAITTCAFSITGTIIQSVFRSALLFWFTEVWVVLSGYCSAILFFFWIGVLGTFARSFSHRSAAGNHGIHMMQIAVYIDGANVVIWFLTILDMCWEMGFAERRETRRYAGGAGGAGAFGGIVRNGTNSSRPFVPHGWDPADIEAQTLAVQNPNPLLRTTTETQSIHPALPRLPLLALPEPPPRVLTAENGRIVSHDLSALFETFNTSSDSEFGKSSSDPGYWPWPFEWDEPTKECPICMEERPCWTGFPFRVAKACDGHEQESCRSCIDRSIIAELDSNISGPIHCAECRAVLEYEEVKALASPTTFIRYERMGIRGFVNDNANFVWCQNRNCPSGQEHVGGVDQPIVTCQACGFKTCFKHQIPWHEQMLCDEYDERVRLSNDERQSRAQQELASIKAIHTTTKPCANKDCKAPIQKTEGCDHMTCKLLFPWKAGEIEK